MTRGACGQVPTSWSGPSAWSRRQVDGGLAHGWHGPGWICLHLIRRRLVTNRTTTIDAIVRRLGHSNLSDTRVSLLIGTGANAVVSSLAATVTGDTALARRHVGQWLEASRASTHTDVMSGVAGAILAACEIEGHGIVAIPRRVVNEWQDAVRTIVRDAVGGRPAHVKLGLAHGLAGLLLALENARSVYGFTTDRPMTRAAVRLLRDSALVAPVRPAALVWPIAARDETLNAHGWCHGAPGIALALSCCAELSRFEAYQDLSESALRGAALVINKNRSTCCGLAGQANVLVEAYRLTGDERWMRRAGSVYGVINRGVDAVGEIRRSLWRGSFGPAFAQLRLQYPFIPFPALGALSARVQ